MSTLFTVVTIFVTAVTIFVTVDSPYTHTHTHTHTHMSRTRKTQRVMADRTGRRYYEHEHETQQATHETERGTGQDGTSHYM